MTGSIKEVVNRYELEMNKWCSQKRVRKKVLEIYSYTHRYKASMLQRKGCTCKRTKCRSICQFHSTCILENQYLCTQHNSKHKKSAKCNGVYTLVSSLYIKMKINTHYQPYVNEQIVTWKCCMDLKAQINELMSN